MDIKEKDSNPKKKVVFVIQSFAGGGAQRAIQLILEGLDRQRFEPSLIILDDVIDYDLPPDVELINLHRKNRGDFVRIIMQLAKVITAKKPHAVVSSLESTNLVCVISVYISRYKTKLILVTQNVTSKILREHRVPWLRLWLVRWLYPYANKIIAVSQVCAEDLMRNFNISGRLVEIIPNPVKISNVQRLANDPLKHPWFNPKTSPIIISVGRLTIQKGYEYLIKAFCLVRKDYPCKLLILGEGENKYALEDLATKVGLSDSLEILPFQKNPFNFIARSDVFVLPSLYEGMPLALLEAMACGTAIIGTTGLSGLEEIITHGENGLLVKPRDEYALADAIRILLTDRDLRVKFSEAGKKRSADFDAEKISTKYADLFDNL